MLCKKILIINSDLPTLMYSGCQFYNSCRQDLYSPKVDNHHLLLHSLAADCGCQSLLDAMCKVEEKGFDYLLWRRIKKHCHILSTHFSNSYLFFKSSNLDCIVGIKMQCVMYVQFISQLYT